MASLLAHGIWLTLILGHSGVDGLDDIGSDGREEHLYNPNQFNPPQCPIPSSSSINGSLLSVSYLWERVSRTTGRAIGGQDADSRTGSHLEGLMTLS
jgi:hypothetical protein